MKVSSPMKEIVRVLISQGLENENNNNGVTYFSYASQFSVVGING